MAITLWKLPIPSSALWEAASFRELGGGVCSVVCLFEPGHGLQIFFEGVEAFKGTYYRACTVEMIDTAYSTLVDLGDTPWLAEVKRQLSDYTSDVTGLRHMMIYFDDGPCFEFICRAFRVEPMVSEEAADSAAHEP